MRNKKQHVGHGFVLGSLMSVGLFACASMVAAQEASSDQTPRFEESVMVTATPRSGSLSEYLLNFSGPVAVPGVSLAPGTYVFRFPQPGGKAIQVLKADKSAAYAIFHTIPVVDVNRDLQSDAHEVTWKKRGPDAPPAIQSWFPPGRTIGYEFIYPDQNASAATSAGAQSGNGAAEQVPATMITHNRDDQDIDLWHSDTLSKRADVLGN